jgi:protein JSN1
MRCGDLSDSKVDALARSVMEEEAFVRLCFMKHGIPIIIKLFERCAEPMRVAMLERLAPHLASISAHSQGFRAALK